jgi:hypothetical protein
MIRTCSSVARGQSANVDSATRDVKELTAIKQAIGENRPEEAPRHTVGPQPPLERSRDGADFEIKIDIEPLVHHVYHFSRRLRAPEADAAWVRRKLGLA